MSHKLVVNKKWRQSYDVYIGRPSKWGNPFIIGKNGNRIDVVNAYEGWLRSQPILMLQAKKELKGKRLACWCAPLICHGNILAEIANAD